MYKCSWQHIVEVVGKHYSIRWVCVCMFVCFTMHWKLIENNCRRRILLLLLDRNSVFSLMNGYTFNLLMKLDCTNELTNLSIYYLIKQWDDIFEHSRGKPFRTCSPNNCKNQKFEFIVSLEIYFNEHENSNWVVL